MHSSASTRFPLEKRGIAIALAGCAMPTLQHEREENQTIPQGSQETEGYAHPRDGVGREGAREP